MTLLQRKILAADLQAKLGDILENTLVEMERLVRPEAIQTVSLAKRARAMTPEDSSGAL